MATRSVRTLCLEVKQGTMRVATNGGGTITDRVVFDDALQGSQCAISATKVETTLPDFESSVLNASQKVGVKASVNSSTKPRS